MGNKINEKLSQWRELNPLRKKREANELQVNDTAAMLDCSLGSVQKWENGSQFPSLAWRNKMHKTLGIPVSHWQKWIDAKPKLSLS